MENSTASMITPRKPSHKEYCFLILALAIQTERPSEKCLWSFPLFPLFKFRYLVSVLQNILRSFACCMFSVPTFHRHSFIIFYPSQFFFHNISNMRFWALLTLVALVAAVPFDGVALQKREDENSVFIGWRTVSIVRQHHHWCPIKRPNTT
jgi:hypothetical protein